MTRRDRRQRGIGKRPAHALWSPERPKRKQPQPMLKAIPLHPLRTWCVVPETELDLNGGDVRDALRLFDSANSHVAKDRSRR